MSDHYYHLGIYYERIVKQIMERNLPHEDCFFYLLPGSGRGKGGDLACPATKFEVKTSTHNKRPTVYAGIPIFCFADSQNVRIEFPFRIELEYPPQTPRLLVSGHFCPVLAQEVHTYPHIIIPQSGKRKYLQPGGTGVLVRNIFVRVETQRCPLYQKSVYSDK